MHHSLSQLDYDFHKIFILDFLISSDYKMNQHKITVKALYLEVILYEKERGFSPSFLFDYFIKSPFKHINCKNLVHSTIYHIKYMCSICQYHDKNRNCKKFLK